MAGRRATWDNFIRTKDHVMDVFEKHKTFISLSGTVLSAAAAWAAYTSRSYRERKMNERLDEINEKLQARGAPPIKSGKLGPIQATTGHSLLEILVVPIAGVSFVAGLTVGRAIYMPKEGSSLAQRSYRLYEGDGPLLIRQAKRHLHDLTGLNMFRPSTRPSAAEAEAAANEAARRKQKFNSLGKYFLEEGVRPTYPSKPRSRTMTGKSGKSN